MSKQQKHAVIFSGGGADGAYEVGVAKALLNGKSPSTHEQSVAPDIFTGTSIGSFNSSFLVAQWDEYGAGSVGNLENIWLDVISKGGFRIRVNPFELLDPRSYSPNPLRPAVRLAQDSAFLGWEGLQRFAHLTAGREPFLQRLLESFNLASFVSATPWEKMIRDSIDFRKIRRSSRRLFVAATNWVLGELRIFTNHDMTDKIGPSAIRASSAVPGFYPIATVGSQRYVDGAVLMNTPLRPAVKAGADVLHVIYMNNDVKNMPVDSLRSTLDTLYRTQIIAWTEAINRDIAMADAFNRGLELLERGENKDRSTGLSSAVIEVLGLLRKIHRAGQAGKYRPLTIHRYFPPDGLDGALGFLDISRPRISRLIDEGFQHTISHDCQANRCILPAAHHPAPS